MTVDQSRRWAGRASLLLSVLAIVLAATAVLGELVEEESRLDCSSVMASWTGLLFFILVPLLALVAMGVGAFAVRGTRWRAVATSCAPLAFVVGLVWVFTTMHPGEAQDWPIFSSCG